MNSLTEWRIFLRLHPPTPNFAFVSLTFVFFSPCPLREFRCQHNCVSSFFFLLRSASSNHRAYVFPPPPSNNFFLAVSPADVYINTRLGPPPPLLCSSAFSLFPLPLKTGGEYSFFSFFSFRILAIVCSVLLERPLSFQNSFLRAHLFPSEIFWGVFFFLDLLPPLSVPFSFV